MEQQKIHEDTWKKKSHSAFEGEAGGMMPFYESLFCSATLHFKGFHKTLYPIFGFFIYWVTSIDNADILLKKSVILIAIFFVPCYNKICILLDRKERHAL